MYGDDLIGAVIPEYRPYFNGRVIANVLSEFGITATDSADKTGETPEVVPIMKAEFLKRGFKQHPVRDELVLAPLRWHSVNDATQWVWSSANLKESTKLNCEAALIEAHGHGPIKFNECK